tara:strand:- start:2375 stop:2728 length:354 start_codon:yes stop_codon:yes gene_type:complete
MKRLSVVVALAMCGSGVGAQQEIDIASCAALDNDIARLDCYDTAVASLETTEPEAVSLEPAPVSTAGPFGIAMGLSKSEVESLVGTLQDAPQPNTFLTTEDPRCRMEFRTFFLGLRQ